MEVEYRLPNLTSTLQIIGCHQGHHPKDWSFTSHHHFLFELIYCKDGTVNQTVGNSSFLLHSGDWLFIKSGVSHATANCSDQPYVYFNLHFDIDDSTIRAKLCESDYIIIRSDHPENELLSTHLAAIEKTFQQNIRPNCDDYEIAINRLIIQSHALGLISAFAKISRDDTPRRTIEGHPTATFTVFETEIAYAIKEKLRSGEHHSIDEIARSLGMSRGRCTRIFTQVFGQSPRQYISTLVLNQAKHLLVHTTFTMEQLAEQLGFQSASHFSRQFRRWTGMPPTAFRPKYSPTHRIHEQ